MKRYELTYREKKIVVRAESSELAIEQYAARPVFGVGRIFNQVHVKNYDADTRGEIWCVSDCDGTRVTAKLI